MKYENRGRVRKIEFEKTPFNYKYVAAYTRLQSPGTYTIAGMEDGDYLLWAWMDMNANGGEEHLNFAEPVGWYQSDSNLAMNKLTIANGERLSGKDIILYRPTPFPAEDTSVAVGSGLYSFRLKRDITVDDIKGVNSFYTLPMQMMFGQYSDFSMPSCSSAVVWGDRTDNSELGRGLIHGKNMDGENDLRKITVNDLLIVAVDPSESGLKRAVAVNWPGFIGMDMGMNESGLILASHSAMSIPDWSATKMLDNDLIYRETLQRTATPQEAWNYWKSMETIRVGGFNTAVSARYLDSLDYPSLTFETDSYGGEARAPVFMDPKDPFSILTTNTFDKYSGVNAGAVSQAGGYRSSLQADDYRYWAMLNLLDDFASMGKTIGTAEMIEILRAASRTEQYDGIPEYSFIGYPDAMKFALAKEDLEKKILEASYGTFVAYDFDEVFDRGR